jgi:uncharacterized protein (DUF1684 family)
MTVRDVSRRLVVPETYRDTLLALVEFEPLYGVIRVPGLPGRWSLRPDGAPGARVELAPGETLLMDGIAVGGVLDVGPVGMMSPQSLALDDKRSVVVFPDPDDGVIWVGLADESAPRLHAFRDLVSYPDDDRWRLPVSFTPASDAESDSTIQRSRGGDQSYPRPRLGWFTTAIEDRRYRLQIGVHGDIEAYVNFRDATSGVESYGGGRYVPLPGSLEAVAAVEILDLNTAVLPPSAFNPLVRCPLPPPSNVIRTAVRAGQRDVVFTSDLS